MECSCAISIDHDGGASVCTEKIVTARKIHTCDECLRKIKPGEKYENVKGCWDGEWATFHICLDCKSIRDVFFESWLYGQVWENFRAEFGYTDSVVPESCIAELTDGARARVCDFIEAGWED